MVEAAGGRGIAVRVDHSRPEQVRTLFERVAEEQDRRLDVLVNDVWGGDPLTRWDTPFWEHPLEDGLALLRQAVETHIITSRYAAPLMVRRGRGLILEITDGTGTGYRGNLFYDLAKVSVIRLALAQSEELRPHGVAALALTPGFLRSEAVLDHFGVAEANWRDAVEKDRYFAESETPTYIGRAVAALAADPNVLDRSGEAVSTWELAGAYDFTDRDGSQPDWGTAFERLSRDLSESRAT
jgi:NAD(P)-dependent dehydrogenase (short-subunit alcohol dehydrogenase family)